MREAIHDALVAGVPAVGGRVYQPHAVPIIQPGATDRADLLPFLVVDEGTQLLDGTWNSLSVLYNVWIYQDEDDFRNIDALEKQVVAALHYTKLVGDDGVQFFVARDQGATSRDGIDPRWAALTRVVPFRAYALTWLSADAYAPDPVAAMRAWTAAHWPTLGTDPATWTPSDAAPAVYWRVARIGAVERVAAGGWISPVLVGHVLAPGPQARRAYTRRLAEQLAIDERAWMSDGGPLLFGAVRADSEADAMRTGQVELTARYGVVSFMPQPSSTGLGLTHAHVKTYDPPETAPYADQAISVP